MAENMETQQLEDLRDQNRKLLVWSSADDKNGRQNINPDRWSPVVIKQEPNYAKCATHEVPRNYAPQQRYAKRDQSQRNLPNNNIFITKGQPPNYYSARGAPREDDNFGRKYNPG